MAPSTPLADPPLFCKEAAQEGAVHPVIRRIECGEQLKKGSRDADRNHSPAGGVCWTDDFSGITPGLPQATPAIAQRLFEYARHWDSHVFPLCRVEYPSA